MTYDDITRAQILGWLTESQAEAAKQIVADAERLVTMALLRPDAPELEVLPRRLTTLCAVCGGWPCTERMWSLATWGAPSLREVKP